MIEFICWVGGISLVINFLVFGLYHSIIKDFWVNSDERMNQICERLYSCEEKLRNNKVIK